MPQSERKREGQNVDSELDQEIEKFFRGLDYIRLVGKYGKRSAQVLKFLERHPTAEHDRQFVRRVSRGLLTRGGQ